MVTETKKAKQIFPDVPREKEFLNEKGQVTTVWHHSFTQLYQALQRNFSNEGIQIPQLSTDDLNKILASYTAAKDAGLSLTQANLKNINGKKAFDYILSQEKTFILTFSTPGDATTPIASAAWKTVTLT